MLRNIKICTQCNSEVSLSNYKKHFLSKKCLAGSKQTNNPSLSCKYCNSMFTTSSGRGVHEVQCKSNPQQRVLNVGHVAWNKGKTEETDERVAKSAVNMRNTKKGMPAAGCFAWTTEQRSANAKARGFGGYRENSGHSKKFKVIDSFGKLATLQSTYELECFHILTELGINWVRPKALKYDSRNYFADFYLTDYNIYLDPKNSWKAKLDEEKINKVIEQNNVKVYVLLKEQITKEYISRLTETD